ncbi:MAG: hypothetical protein LBM01_03715 [Christensenellaceae bacterium]|jgi:ribulose-phosphate 3-epimerase|nr:hypothetical protein [Christensenellaceae bacterium]
MIKNDFLISVSAEPADNLALYLGELYEISRAVSIGIHADFMDGKFVPRTRFWNDADIAEFGKYADLLPVDVHIMAEANADLTRFAPYNFRSISTHIENGAAPTGGIVIDNDTEIEPHLAEIKKHKFITLMSVKAGASGQSFNPKVLEKIRAVREFNPAAVIIVDGGINETNLKSVVSAGADVVVMGSAVYKQGNKTEYIKGLYKL